MWHWTAKSRQTAPCPPRVGVALFVATVALTTVLSRGASPAIADDEPKAPARSASDITSPGQADTGGADTATADAGASKQTDAKQSTATAPGKNDQPSPSDAKASDATGGEASRGGVSTSADHQGGAVDDTAAASNKDDPLKGVPSYGAALIRMVVVLISLIIVLLLAAKLLPRWLSRKWTGGRGRGGTMRVVDSMQLEPRRRLYLVRVGDQFILIGTSEQGLHTLADRTLDGEKLLAALKEKGKAADGPSISFASVLGSKGASRRAAPDGE